MNLFTRMVERLYLKSNDNLVYFDSVTSCKTRYYFDNVVKTKYRKGEYCIIFADIDKLKKVNDTQGHNKGTQLIKEVGRTLLKLKGVYDVCRIGGDEFVLICKKDFDMLQFRDISHISYGSYVKEYFEDISSAVRKADESMYEMKRIKNDTLSLS